MNEYIREHYHEAGIIAAQVLKEAGSCIKEDMSLLEVAQFAENRIKDLGGNIAFPCNISLNEIASHYTPDDDKPRFKKGDVVKIDVGVHIEGYIADTAKTVEIGTENHIGLIRASKDALDHAILSIRDSVQTRTVGKIIEETITKHGFNTIKDLTGHSLTQYKLHAGISIPNYGSFFSQKIKKDMVFAIEPFATYGHGDIRYGKPHIYSAGKARTKAHQAIMNRFGSLPFARRWVPEMSIDDLKGLREYFELIESSAAIVAQSEHTVIVGENGCEVITK
ncbi:MAG: type II methionyl aminopeptidase [Candidatus Methanoperedens sp.]|nr:type II methionyl aminopeptidase [Candidatus Methanoperedens sp.]